MGNDNLAAIIKANELATRTALIHLADRAIGLPWSASRRAPDQRRIDGIRLTWGNVDGGPEL